MDGTSRTVLHNTDLDSPIGLTIDYKDQRLYWVEAKLHIESSNVDGTGRVVVTTDVYNPFHISFYQGRLYWTDWKYDAVFTVHSTLQNNVTQVVGLPYAPGGIHVIASSRQPEGTTMLKPLAIHVQCSTRYSKFAVQVETAIGIRTCTPIL